MDDVGRGRVVDGVRGQDVAAQRGRVHPGEVVVGDPAREKVWPGQKNLFLFVCF